MPTSATFFFLTALLLDPIAAFAALDLNSNGQSDVWENTFRATGLLPGEDEDRDGVSNADESVAGTDPWNPASKLLPQMATGALPPGQIGIQWKARAHKEYILWTSPDLSPDSWSLYDQWIGGDATAEMILSLPGSSTLFMRLEVNDVDTDGDGLNDWEEALLGYDPETPNSMRLPTADYTRAAGAVVSGNTISISSVDATTHEGWPAKRAPRPPTPTTMQFPQPLKCPSAATRRGFMWFRSPIH